MLLPTQAVLHSLEHKKRFPFLPFLPKFHLKLKEKARHPSTAGVPNFLAPGTNLVEDSFSTSLGGEGMT